MNLIGTSLLVLTLTAVDDKSDQPAPKFPIGKDTTYVDGPLDKDGYIDYEAALNDRLSKGITPEKNANVLLWKAFGPTPEGAKVSAEIFKRLGMEEPPAHGDYFIGPQEFTRDYLKLDKDGSDAFYDQLKRAAKRPWTAKDFPQVASWLKANEKPLAVVVEATRRPDYYNPIICQRNEKNRGPLIGALLPSMQKCRVAADALDARAMLRIGEGTFDEAWQDLLACHRLGRVVTRGPSLIEALIGMAIDAIASRADLVYLERANVTTKQVLDRLNDLQGLPSIPPIAGRIDLDERFSHLDSLRVIRRGGVRALQALAGEAVEKPDAEDPNALEQIDWALTLRTRAC